MAFPAPANEPYPLAAALDVGAAAATGDVWPALARLVEKR